MFDRWLKDCLAQTGRSQRALAKHLRVSESVVSRMLSGLRPLKASEILRIADFFGVSPPLSTNAPVGVVEVPVVAAVSADVWRKGGVPMARASVQVPVVPDQKFAGLKQQAVRVDGDDCDSLAPIGAFVVFVPYYDVRKRPQHGDVVYVVQRQGDLTEHTLRRVNIAHDNVIRLETLSRDKSNRTFVNFPSDAKSAVEIVGLAIGLYQSL